MYLKDEGKEWMMVVVCEKKKQFKKSRNVV